MSQAQKQAAGVDRLWRRILMMFGRGRTSAPANDSGTIQTLQVVLGPFETQDVAKRLAEFGFTSNPPVGSDVLMAFVCGNRDNGVIIATGHQQTRPTGLAPGETKVYDAFGNFIYIGTAGIEIYGNGLPVKINAPEVATTSVFQAGNGATGVFQSEDGKTITVENGIVTNIS